MASSDDSPNRLTTTIDFPEEQSLRHVIRTRFPNGMPEDSIAIIMRQILKTLNYLYVSDSSDHYEVNSSKICVDTEQDRTTIKLAVEPVEHLWKEGGPARKEGEASTEGIWRLGTTALEMGYGSLPKDCDRIMHLARLSHNMIRILKLTLAYPDEKVKEKAKNKGKEELESAEDQKLKEEAIQKGKGKMGTDDDQEMEEKAMQKGKEKLDLADAQEMKEKAMQKGKEKLEVSGDQELKEKSKETGKEKLEVSDDQELKEKAKQKGKGKLEIADEELKQSTITLPGLEKLLKTGYVEHLEKKLKEKKKKRKKNKVIVALKEKLKKARNIFGKNKNKNADDREFSRDFLEVVLMCLEEFELTAVEQILDHPFFQQPIDMQEFERSMRSPLPIGDDN